MAENINIAGRLHSTATGNVVAGANEIYDDTKGKKQSVVNQETDAALDDRYTKSQTYSKTELNNMITTPNQEFVTVTATDQTTAVTDVLPATGSADTTYRVGNWDGSQFDASVYSEYAWDGSQYVHLDTKTQIGEVFDISAYHATGGTLATYDNLNDALNGTNGGVPQSLQKGGMSVKYVCTYDNKYVQARCMADSFTSDVTQWQGVDNIPVSGSKNLVESGGVKAEIYKITGVHETESGSYNVTANWQVIHNKSYSIEGSGRAVMKIWSEDGAEVQINGAVKDEDNNYYSNYPVFHISDTNISEESAYTINYDFNHGLSNIHLQTANKVTNGTVKFKIILTQNGITDSLDLKIKNLSKEWQGVDNIPVSGSKNLVESGGVKAEIYKITGVHETESGSYNVTANWQVIHNKSYSIEGSGRAVMKIWSEDGAEVQINGAVKDEDNNYYSNYPVFHISDTNISEESAYTINYDFNHGLSNIHLQTANKVTNGTVKFKIILTQNGITDSLDLKIKNLSKDVLIFNDNVTPSYKTVVNVNVDIPKNIGITIEATSDTASGALKALYKFDDDSEVYSPQIPIVAGSTTKTVFDNVKPLKQIFLASNNSITDSGNIIIKISENLAERISDNTNSINDIDEEIDGIADVVKTGNVAVVQSQYKSVINLTDVVTSENVPLIIKVWSEDGATGRLDGAITDFSGNYYQTWPTLYITDQTITEATAAYLEYPIPNGVSKIQFDAQAGKITASGTIKWKVVLKGVEGLKSIAENNVVNLGRELFPTIINAENYLKKARRKFVVWIDDDGEPNGLAKVNTICQAKNIRCTMAVVTNRFSEAFGQQTRLDVYKNYQSMGYDIVSHSHTHGTYWYSDNPAYNINSIREDVVNTYKAMIENGFTAKCLVYPGAGGYDSPARREVSQYFQFAFVAGYNLPTTPCKGNRYYIDRFFMQAQSDPNKTSFIAYVNACENSGRMPILASHSAVESWNTEWDDTYMAECIQYMIDEGYTFVTASQAMEITRGMYDLLDMFNASV